MTVYRTLLCLIGAALLEVAPARARTILITPADDFRAMESAEAGDVVEIAPGSYRFRVNFTRSGTPERPIEVRAQDPARPPVWDLGGVAVGEAPGSYTAGDRGRGCWQFRGGHYRVQGIVFRNCVDHSSAGIRVVNMPGIHVRGCLFQRNTNGLTGAGDDLRIEFSEFDGNGAALQGDPPAHSIYIYGGTLLVRFSYFHDSPSGQHFHVRSREAELSYNWFSRPGSYAGDLMTCEYLCGGAQGGSVTQRMLLLGNVIVQGTPQNGSQILALLKDGAGSIDGSGDVAAMELTLLHNTILGTPRAPGQSHRLVNLRNDTVVTRLRASNNVVVRVATLAEAARTDLGNFSVTGAGNWMTTGSIPAGVSGTRFGAEPGLGPGYVPVAQSPVTGLAVAGEAAVPQAEYYRDEQVKLMGRTRLAATESGAFESTTAGPPFGWQGPPAEGGPSDGGAPLPGEAGAGCACRTGGSGTPGGAGLLVLLLLVLRCARAGQGAGGRGLPRRAAHRT